MTNITTGDVAVSYTHLDVYKRQSTDRAMQMRQLLEAAALDQKRIERVTGHADRKPAVRNPLAVRNNRLEIILLRSDD